MPVGFAMGCAFEAIRRIACDINRVRAKIMNAGNPDVAALDRTKNAFQLRDPQSVPKLDGVDAHS
jgi:hypothetical protein